MKFSQMPYSRVDADQLKKDFAQLEKDFDAAASGEEQFAVHQRYYQLTARTETQMVLAEIRHDIDMTDEFYGKEQDYYDENRPVFQNLIVSYQKKLYHSPLRAYLEQKIGPVAFKNMELSMKSVDPSIISLM